MRTLPFSIEGVPAEPRVEPRGEQGPSLPGSGTGGGVDFGAELSSALSGVERMQLDADREATKAALGAGNLHELSLSLEKADVAMRVANKVRNKLVDAYHELMRMSI
ncbi:MAG: flagellar hook-basal body complex protein FliE [Myxococcaceae bacterium]|nr:flagellar hook-basal body complex protein FliE [Myxococcaceae bacterium]